METAGPALKVVVAIVKLHDHFLVLQRKKSEGNLTWSFPGGKIRSNETLEHAAEREVFEETGVQCKAEILLGERIHPDTHRHIYYVLCGYASGDGSVKEPELCASVTWLNGAEVLERFTSDVFGPVRKMLEIVSTQA